MDECFCLNCGCKQPYRVKSQVVARYKQGKAVCYEEEDAVCAICGEEVYPPEVNERNAVYREAAMRNG